VARTAQAPTAPSTAAPALPTWAVWANPTAEIVLAGASIAGLLALLVSQAPVWNAEPKLPPGPGQAVANSLGWPAIALSLGFLIALCLPFRPYALGIAAARRAHSTRVLLGAAAAVAVVALLMYPAYGSDMFMYVAFERLWTVYGENPLVALTSAHPGDWAYAFVWVTGTPNPYGPVWVLLNWPIVQLAGTSALGLVVGYKLIALCSYLACCALIWSSLPPAERASRVVLFAWSPLVLFEGLGKAHNDLVLAVAALAAVRLGARGGMLAATAGALVKLSGLAVLPALAVPLVRERRWAALAAGAGAAAALATLAYAPFWEGPGTLTAVGMQISWNWWSPAALAIAAGLDAALVRITLTAVCIGVTLLILLRVRDPATAAAGVYLAALLLLTSHFFAHYLVPVVALAALSPNRALQRSVLALSLGAMAAYAVDPLQLAMPAGWAGSPAYQILGSVVLIGPLVALWVSEMRNGRHSSARSRPDGAAPA